MISTEDLVGVAEHSQEFKALAQLGLSVVREFSEELGQAGDLVAQGVAGLSAKLYQSYLLAGFSEEQAFTLLLNSQYSLQKAISGHNSSSKETKTTKEPTQ